LFAARVPRFQLCVLYRTVQGYVLVTLFIMAALRSRCGHYIFALWFLSIFYLFLFLA